MQEEVEARSAAVIISAAKLTGSELRYALRFFLDRSARRRTAERGRDRTGGNREKEGKVPPASGETHETGTAEEILRNAREERGSGETDIRDFDTVAKKHGVKYTVYRDDSGSMPRFSLLFRARSGRQMSDAFREYLSLKEWEESRDRPSVLRAIENLSRGRAADMEPLRDREIIR